MTTYWNKKTKVIVLAILVIVCVVMQVENVRSGTYTSTMHGTSADRSTISGVGSPYSDEYFAGHCGHCHDQHASVGGVEPTPPAAEGATPFCLFKDNYGGNKNELCYACHDTFNFDDVSAGAGRYGSYKGHVDYANSIHNKDTDMVWPDAGTPGGPTYDDYGNCHNCHNPHGYDDGSGLIPRMLFKREEELCEECHWEIQFAANKPTSRHPIHEFSDRHTVDESGKSGFGRANKHAECVDCHNPHAIGATNPSSPTVHPNHADNPDYRTADSNLLNDSTFGSQVLQGVWGVDVSVWPERWDEPTIFNVLKSSSVTKEYQICFKCHSYYADEGTAGTRYRVAKDFNPNNRSSHPVVVKGSLSDHRGLPSLDVEGMRNPWKTNLWNQTMYCSDCHGNDDEVLQAHGPHGSYRPHMLKSFRTNDRSWWPNGPHGSAWRLYDLREDTNNWSTYLFCNACHVVSEWTTGHGRTGHHLSYYTCQTCHIKRVHGWYRVRFIKATVKPYRVGTEVDCKVPEDDIASCNSGGQHTPPPS